MYNKVFVYLCSDYRLRIEGHKVMKTYFKVLVLLVVPLLMVVSNGMLGDMLWGVGCGPERIDMSREMAWMDGMMERWGMGRPEGMDEVCVVDSVVDVVNDEEVVDTAKQRILLFGDSMVEGLGKRLCDYATENGHELHSVCWYSSSSKIWAETDTLQYFMDRVRPTYVMIALCSNEQFVRDLNKREVYIDSILARLGDVPYVWIAPPSWKKDTGINDLICRKVGRKRFFDSTKLEYERGNDHVHPTDASAEMWMDSIARWMMCGDVVHRIRMEFPTEKRRRKWDGKYLKPAF